MSGSVGLDGEGTAVRDPTDLLTTKQRRDGQHAGSG